MKVICNGKEMFEIDIPKEIPEVIEINEETGWNDKWALFAIMSIFNGNVKFNEEYIKEIKEKYEDKQKYDCLQASEEDILKLHKMFYKNKGE